MAGSRVEFADWAGVDSRSSPLRLPPGRALRNKNWRPMPNGVLQLRHGYTRPAMSGVSDGAPIHSAAFYELHDGTQQILYSQGSILRLYNMASGAVSTVSSVTILANGLPWNGTFADDRFLLGNGDDRKIFDGVTLRNIGIQNSVTLTQIIHSGLTTIINVIDAAAAVTVSYSTASSGSWQTTEFLGYQLFMCFYNPVTGHIGNRASIGARFTVGTPNGVVNLTGLPNLSTIDPEWVKLIGRTGDNGLAPNALIDPSGTFIIVGNTFTTATIVSPATDPESELPTRNGMPPRFNKISYALGRACAIDEDDPSAVRFSESLADVPSGLFMGDPRQAWPPSNKQFFPTGERCRSIHAVDSEHWVWTRNHLGILSEFQAADSSLGKPVLQWRGTWVGGIANHRAFVKTKHGPFWVSTERQIMSRPTPASYQSGAAGPVPISTDYDAALLARIVDLETIEMAYLLDPEKDIDCLYVTGLDINNQQVVIVHDFGAGGIGREHVYNVRLNTFVRNPDQVVSVRDTTSKMRLWAGTNTGIFVQLEDGDSDASATYSADCVMIYNGGPKNPTLGAIEWFGDSDVEITVSKDLRLTLQEIDDLESLPAISVDENTSLWRSQVEEKAQFMTLRFQIESHPADGTLAFSSPIPHVPLEIYGRVYMARPEIGMGRDIGGSKP